MKIYRTYRTYRTAAEAQAACDEINGHYSYYMRKTHPAMVTSAVGVYILWTYWEV